MDPNSITPFRATHRATLARLLEEARRRQPGNSRGLYLGGYCPGSTCDVRDVLVRVKDLNESVAEFRCPACRLMLTFGSHEFQVDCKTMAEYEGQRDQEARDNVATQLAEARAIRNSPIQWRNLGDICRGTTLTELRAEFAKDMTRRSGDAS
jgi:hypothetical protein